MYQKALIFFGIVGVGLSLLLGIFSLATWEVVAVLVAVSLGTSSLLLAYEKLTSEVSVKAKEKERKQEQEVRTEEKVILQEETISIPPEAGSYYDFQLKRGKHLKGEISSDVPIDIYFVDNTNFRKWQKEIDFNYVYCNEWVLETKIDYVVPKKGTWYLLLDNNDERKPALVKMGLYLSSD